MSSVATNVQFDFPAQPVNKVNQFLVPVANERVVSFRINLRTHSVAHSNNFTSRFKLGFGKIFGSFHAFVHQAVGKVGIHHQVQHHIFNASQITCFGQWPFNPANDGDVSPGFF
jgi:hypothetical protein